MQGLSVTVEQQGQVVIRMTPAHAEDLFEILRMAEYFTNEIDPVVVIKHGEDFTPRWEVNKNHLSRSARNTLTRLLSQVADVQMKFLLEEF